MKVIFLDIDGVLIRFWNTAQIRKTRAEKRQTWIINEFDDDLANNLKRIIKETNCKIVISSSWRYDMNRVKNAFKKAWLPTDIIIWRTWDWFWYGRGNEILHFLNDYHEKCWAWLMIRRWLAIDDDTFDMKAITRLWRLIKTETHIWLDSNKTKEVIKILNYIY